jgi:Protein of unknown function (DUF2971)
MTIPSDLKSELEAFERESDAVASQFVSRELEARPPPSILYHYTDDAGLKGILESGTLRLTAVSNLNDPSELKHGFSHAVEIINRRAAEGPPECKMFAQQFERFLIEDGINAVAHYFVGCFSAAGDDLGQWRAYADNGRGFSLAFDTAFLEDAFVKASKSPTSDSSTFRLVYNDAIAARMHMQIIDAMFPLISLPLAKRLKSQTLHEYGSELLTLTLMHCVRSALFFKHEAYANEAEYRFLQVHMGPPYPGPEVKYRTRPYELVRYREFDWRANASAALKKVVVGPAADKTKAALFVKECLRAHHRGPSVELANSAIPYRS